MVAVGMEKQQLYDKGVERIQSQIDQVGGLDIYRPEDRQHLQNKLNELGSKLKTVAAADFSNNQLVNSIGGMTSNIAKDPFVMAAVESTAVIKSNNSVIEKAREEGKLTPDNEFYYNKQLEAYVNSGLTDESGKPIKFNRKYDPYFDVMKFAKETFDAVKPDNMTWDQVYETDSEGNHKIDAKTGMPIYSPVMIRMEKEGIFPKKVKETLDQIFSDPRVSKQLQITGEYNYRNLDSQAIKNKLKSQHDSVKINIDEQLEVLHLKKNTTTVDDEKKQIDIEIGKLETAKTSIGEYYNSLIESSDSNSDQVKGVLYNSEVKDRYTTMFGYTKTKTTNMENPGWNANYKLQQASFERYKFKAEMDFKQDRANKEDVFRQLTLAQKQAELDLKDPRANLAKDYSLANMPSNFDIVFNQEEQFDQVSTDYNNKSNELIYTTIFKTDPVKLNLYNQYIDQNKSHDEAIQLMIEKQAKDSKMDVSAYKTSLIRLAENQISFNQGRTPEDVLDAMSEYQQSRKVFQDSKAVKDNVDKVAGDVVNQTISKLYGDGSIKPQTVKFRGRDVELSKTNVIDLGVYLRGYKHVFGMFIDDNARQAAKSAEARLRNSGKGEILDYMMRQDDALKNDPITYAARLVAQPIESFKDLMNNQFFLTGMDFSQVERVYDALNNDDYTKALEEKAKVYKQFMMVPPNLNAPTFTGNTEGDKNTLIRLKNTAMAYGEADNLSPDFQTFLSNISAATDPSKLNIQFEARPVFGGAPQVEAIMYSNETGVRVGGMTIEPSDASKFINTSTFVPDEIAVSENFLKSNRGKTSNGNPDDIETFTAGDTYFKKSNGDFPNLSSISGYDIQANITTSGGKYYGKIYVKDNKTSKIYDIFTTPGSPSYATMYNSIKSIGPGEIGKIVSEQNAKTK
jgi:hypothetical protein